ncbi:hypothetical protein AB1E19_016284 [Capra hircus]
MREKQCQGAGGPVPAAAVLPETDCEQSRQLDLAMLVTEVIAYTHCCVNPVIYAFVEHRFVNCVTAPAYPEEYPALKQLCNPEHRFVNCVPAPAYAEQYPALKWLCNPEHRSANCVPAPAYAEEYPALKRLCTALLHLLHGSC